MLDQRKLIDGKDWQYLIVLDACRYDHFRDNYAGYLKGDLRRARSPVVCENGVATSEWAKSVFKKRYDDVVYVSTTPHINSKKEVNGFKASEHFDKIVDVWLTGWDDDKGTVLPAEVNRSIVEARGRYPGKRIIAHYMQPHFPYLSLENPANPKNRDPAAHDNLKRNIRNALGSRIRKVLGGDMTRKLLNAFGFPPATPMHEVLEREGHDGLVDAYIDNLVSVLASLQELVEELQGISEKDEKLVVTADHGEYLGEDGFYGHSYLPGHKVLNVVPWLEVQLSSHSPD